MKRKVLFGFMAVMIAVAVTGVANASVILNLDMLFQSGGEFKGDVTFADDYSLYSAVNGTLTGGTNSYNSAITWVWDSTNRSSGSDNFSNWLMDSNSSHYIQLAYNYSNAPNLVFTSGVSYNGFDNYVNYTDPMASGTFGPVPIPGAVWLFGSGLVGLAGLRRKFRS